jgi:hypothetical protein
MLGARAFVALLIAATVAAPAVSRADLPGRGRRELSVSGAQPAPADEAPDTGEQEGEEGAPGGSGCDALDRSSPYVLSPDGSHFIRNPCYESGVRPRQSPPASR